MSFDNKYDIKSSRNLIRFSYYIQSIVEIKYDVLIYSIESIFQLKQNNS